MKVPETKTATKKKGWCVKCIIAFGLVERSQHEDFPNICVGCEDRMRLNGEVSDHKLIEELEEELQRVRSSIEDTQSEIERMEWDIRDLEGEESLTLKALRELGWEEMPQKVRRL